MRVGGIRLAGASIVWLPIVLALLTVLLVLLVLGAVVWWRQLKHGDVPVLKKCWQPRKQLGDGPDFTAVAAGTQQAPPPPPFIGNGDEDGDGDGYQKAKRASEEHEYDELAATSGSGVPLVVVSDAGAHTGANGKGAGAGASALNNSFSTNANSRYNNLDLTHQPAVQSQSSSPTSPTSIGGAIPITQQPPPPPPHRPSSRMSRGSTAEADQLLTKFGSGGGISGTIDSRPGPVASAIPLKARIATADLDEGDPV